MSNGACMEYNFGQKKNWRRWAWNRVIERLRIPPAEALVVYLAGANDFDREVALQKGFKECNLIAVERDKKALSSLRSRGVLCVYGDFLDTLYSWPAHTTVHAVIGDLCCGLDIPLAFKINNLYGVPALSRGLVNVWNFMRGREVLGFNKAFDQKATITRGVAETGAGKSEIKEEVLHRGNQLMKALSLKLTAAYLHQSGVELPENDKLDAIAARPEAQKQVLAQIWRVGRPAFNSYRSISGQTFDSIAWTFADVSREAGDSLSPMYVEEYRPSNQRNVAAILAHRTMRMR